MFGNLFNPSKWTLGTLADAAGLVGGGIVGGVIPGSQALGAGLGLLGATAGSEAKTGANRDYEPSDLEKKFSYQTGKDLDFINQNSPKRYQSLLNAYDALDPRNIAQNAQYARSQFLQQGDLTGRRNADILSRKGYGSGVADAARLDAMNRANEQGNSYFNQLSNPAARAGMYQAQAGLLGNMALANNSLSGQMSLQQQRNNQRLSDLYYENNRPATGLESLLQLAGKFDLFGGSNNQSNRFYEEPIGPNQPTYAWSDMYGNQRWD